MDQAKVYLGYACYAGLIICFVMLLWQFLKHRQWKMALLSLVTLPICGGGFLVALIIGWQEAGPWQIKKLMRYYTLLFVICTPMFLRGLAAEMMTPHVYVDPKELRKKKAIEDFNRAHSKVKIQDKVGTGEGVQLKRK